MPRRSRVWAGGSLLAVLTAAMPARAQVDLKWEAPSSCPQANFVHEKVRSLSGEALSRAEPLRAEGAIEPDGEGFRLTLRVTDGSDVRERVITSESCADLAGAAAVTLALLLKASADRAPDETTGPSDGAAGPERAGAAAANDRERVSTASQSSADASNGEGTSTGTSKSSDWAFILQVPVLVFDYGPLPRPNTGAGLSAGFKLESVRVLAGARVFLAQSLTSPSRARTGAEVRRATGSVLACRSFGGERLELSPCVSLTLEHLSARGFGTGVAPQSRAALWVAPGAGLLAHIHTFEHLALFAGADARVEVSRPRLHVEGSGEVARLAPAAFSGSIGAEWIF